MEIRGYFSISKKEYVLFVERGIFTDKLYLFECKADSLFLQPVPIKVTTSTFPEMVRHWLEESKRYLVKKRNKKCSQARCGNPGNSP